MLSFRRTLAIPVCVMAMLGACGPSIDVSSAQSYAASVQKIQDKLDDAQKKEFQQALVVLAFDTVDPSTGLFSEADPKSPVFFAAGDKIKGLSGEDVIKAGHKRQLELLDKAIAEDGASIQRVASERAKHADVIGAIKILNPEFKTSKNVLDTLEPEVSFTVTNGSKTPISEIQADGILTSRGRSVPWISSSISYKIPGGLEPGETKHFDLAPNPYGDWKVQDEIVGKPVDLKLTLTNLKDASGASIIPTDLPSIADVTADMAAKERLRERIVKGG
jgi:hypothetical protein